MSKWYSIGFVGACIVFSALPIPYTAGFEAGGDTPCTKSTETKKCKSNGKVNCAIEVVRCGGTIKNASSCSGEGGTVACDGTNNCAAANHAVRDNDCK